MHLVPRSAVGVVAASLVLVLGLEVSSIAANGKPLLAGKTTKATKATTLVRTTSGPALTLKSRPTSPPLKVTSSAKVERLNADLLDGLSATDLQDHAVTFRDASGGGAPTSSRSWAVLLDPGAWQLSWSAGVRNFAATPAAPAGFRCYVTYTDPDGIFNYGLVDSVTATGAFNDNYMSASGVIMVGDTGPTQLTCSGTTAHHMTTGVPLQISAIPVAHVSPLAASSGRSATRASRGAGDLGAVVEP